LLGFPRQARRERVPHARFAWRSSRWRSSSERTRSSREFPDHVDIEEQIRAHGELIAALHRAILDLADEIEQLKQRD
jgi:arginase family enzyme